MKKIEIRMRKLDNFWSDLPLYASRHIKPEIDSACSRVALLDVCHKYIIIMEDSNVEKIVYSFRMVILPIFEILTGKCYQLIALE